MPDRDEMLGDKGRCSKGVVYDASVGSPFALSEVGDLTMIFDGRWKMVVNSGSEVLQLFDTAEDPPEAINLAGRADTGGVVDRLRRELLNFLLCTADRQFREVNS